MKVFVVTACEYWRNYRGEQGSVVFYNEDHDGKMTEVELDPSKEEIEKTCFGLVWLDKRDARYPARRLLHPVLSIAR